MVIWQCSSFSFFNPCYFDEATQPEVSMTESHTRCASRGHCASRKLFSLNEKQHFVAGQWFTHRLYFLHTVRTQRIEPDAVLLLHQVCCQRGCSLHVGVRRIVSGLTAGAQE